MKTNRAFSNPGTGAQLPGPCVPVGLFLQPAQVTLNGTPALERTIWFAPPHFGVICKSVGSAFLHLLQVVDEDVKEERPWSTPLVTDLQVVQTTSHHLLIPTIQPVSFWTKGCLKNVHKRDKQRFGNLFL